MTRKHGDDVEGNDDNENNGKENEEEDDDVDRFNSP